MLGAIVGVAFSEYKALKAAIEYETTSIHRIFADLHSQYPTDIVAETLTGTEKVMVNVLGNSKFRDSIEANNLADLKWYNRQYVKFFSGTIVFELLKTVVVTEPSRTMLKDAGLNLEFLQKYWVVDPATACIDGEHVAQLLSIKESNIQEVFILRTWQEFLYLYPDVVAKVKASSDTSLLQKGVFALHCYKELMTDPTIKEKMFSASKYLTFTLKAQNRLMEMISAYQ